MKLLHVTESKNVNSIIQNGLLPTHIENDGHWDYFQRYLTRRQCVYLWSAETFNNAKYVRDLIYTKMFIHPRNRIFTQRENEIIESGLDLYDGDNYIDFSKMGTALVGDSTQYSVLEIDSKDVDLHGSWFHVQEPTDEKSSTTTIMDEFYAHDDKELYISGNTINGNSVKIVEEVLVRKYKSGKLGFSFRKNKL